MTEKDYKVIFWSKYGLHAILEDDGDRNGLNGGNRENGDASNVNYNWRDNANDNLSVRLVLSRKQEYGGIGR